MVLSLLVQRKIFAIPPGWEKIKSLMQFPSKTLLFLKMLQRMNSLRADKLYSVSLPLVKKEDKNSGFQGVTCFHSVSSSLSTIFFPMLMVCKPLCKPWPSIRPHNPRNRGTPCALFTWHLCPSLLLYTALYLQVQFQHTSFWSYLQTHVHIWNKHIWINFIMLQMQLSSLLSFILHLWF